MKRYNNTFKPCKGTGIAKGHGCGKETQHRIYGLGKMCCYATWLLTTDAGKLKLEKAKIKSKSIVKNAQKEKEKKQRENITNYKVKLQNKVNEIARLIDHGLPCLATGRNGQMHGGHVFSRGSSPNIRYNLHNIHRQCAQSNHFQSDDIKMREGLVREYGKEYFKNIEKLRENFPPLKYSNSEYMEFFKIACKLANELKKNLTVNDSAKRLKIRQEINEKIGIYK